MAQDDSKIRLSDIASQIDAIREKFGMASAYVVLVDHDKTLLSQGVGIRAWDDPQPVTNTDYYRLGSVTKAFTGLALLKAEEQDCLTLTDPVLQNVNPPVITNQWAETHLLTVAMLMEHTAGIHEMSVEEFAFNDPVLLQQALQISPDSRITAWPPGLHSEYSNSGPGMVGWLVQQGCHTDFGRHIEENVFRPLSMPSATLNRTPEVVSALVGGYNTNPKEPIEFWHFIFRPAAAANVRPEEMANFLRMLLNKGTLDGKEIFSSQQIQRMETPTTTITARAGLDYGYGLGINATRSNAITGTYERATIRFPKKDWQLETLSISRRDGRLGYECDDGWCELIPVSEELFRLSEEPVATTAIVNVDGQIFLQGRMGNWRKRDE